MPLEQGRGDLYPLRPLFVLSHLNSLGEPILDRPVQSLTGNPTRDKEKPGLALRTQMPLNKSVWRVGLTPVAGMQQVGQARH